MIINYRTHFLMKTLIWLEITFGWYFCIWVYDLVFFSDLYRTPFLLWYESWICSFINNAIQNKITWFDKSNPILCLRLSSRIIFIFINSRLMLWVSAYIKFTWCMCEYLIWFNYEDCRKKSYYNCSFCKCFKFYSIIVD